MPIFYLISVKIGFHIFCAVNFSTTVICDQDRKTKNFLTSPRLINLHPLHFGDIYFYSTHISPGINIEPISVEKWNEKSVFESGAGERNCSKVRRDCKSNAYLLIYSGMMSSYHPVAAKPRYVEQDLVCGSLFLAPFHYSTRAVMFTIRL